MVLLQLFKLLLLFLLLLGEVAPYAMLVRERNGYRGKYIGGSSAILRGTRSSAGGGSPQPRQKPQVGCFKECLCVGILRRGLTVEALLEFILQQGPSKAGNLMEWDKLWTLNKQVIDPIVPRFMAVSRSKL